MIGALVFAGLTVSVMSTLGTPLIPTIAEAQHVSLETAQWMLTVTLLVGAIATPVLGRLGDGPQRRTVLIFTLASTLVGSIVAATSSAFPQLLVGRALQGIGYGTVPLAIALVREHADGERQRSGIATLSITVAVGAGLGFPVTGLIAQLLDFHAAFWFGAIFAVGSTLAVLAFVPKAERPRQSDSARRPRGAAAGRRPRRAAARDLAGRDARLGLGDRRRLLRARVRAAGDVGARRAAPRRPARRPASSSRSGRSSAPTSPRCCSRWACTSRCRSSTA